MAHETVTWLNADFTEKVLRLAEVDSTIEVIDISAKPATNKGDNYTSDMVRVVAEFTRKSKAKVTEKKSLLFKFEPIVEGPRKDMMSSCREINFPFDFSRNQGTSFFHLSNAWPRFSSSSGVDTRGGKIFLLLILRWRSF